MAASSIAELLDYETNIEDALKTHLTSSLGSTQILTSRTLLTSQEIVTTPRVTVAVQISGTNPNQQAQRTTDNAEYDCHKLGSVTLDAVIRRNGSGQSLTTLRGGIRKAMLEATSALNGTTLPYYQVITLREGSSAPSYDKDNDEIMMTMTYALEFFIKPDQWPVS